MTPDMTSDRLLAEHAAQLAEQKAAREHDLEVARRDAADWTGTPYGADRAAHDREEAWLRETGQV